MVRGGYRLLPVWCPWTNDEVVHKVGLIGPNFGIILLFSARERDPLEPTGSIPGLYAISNPDPDTKCFEFGWRRCFLEISIFGSAGRLQSLLFNLNENSLANKDCELLHTSPHPHMTGSLHLNVVPSRPDNPALPITSKHHSKCQDFKCQYIDSEKVFLLHC